MKKNATISAQSRKKNFVSHLRALLGWTIIVMAGSVAGWSVSFFGVIALFIISGLWGWAIGRIVAKYITGKHIAVSLVMLFSGLAARLAMSAMILMDTTNPIPPYGAFQSIVDLIQPVPLQLIALVFICVVTGFVVHRRFTGGLPDKYLAAMIEMG